MTPFLAELIGTAVLILLGNGVVANVVLNDTKGNNSGWIVITTAWALAVFTAVTIAGPVSGAHLNPAVTVGLAMGGLFEWSQVLPYIAAQIIGGFIGGVLVYLFYIDHFKRTDDEAGKLACFATGPAIRNIPINIISEIIGTFILIFGVFYIAGPSFESETVGEAIIGLGSIGAIPVSFIVWVIGLSLGGTTGYAINPARDLGPRIAHAVLPVGGGSDWSYSWVPVVGPLIGAAAAAGLYLLFI